MLASKENQSKTPSSRKIRNQITSVVAILIVIILILGVAVGYFFGTSRSVATQTTTVVTTVTASTALLTPTCVTLHNCVYSYVYFDYGASLDKGLYFSPQNITVTIGHNNTVVWQNLDIVTQSIVGANNLFSSGSLKPGALFNYTFTTPGLYNYASPTYAWEKGTVTVVRSVSTSITASSGNNF